MHTTRFWNNIYQESTKDRIVIEYTRRFSYELTNGDHDGCGVSERVQPWVTDNLMGHVRSIPII